MWHFLLAGMAFAMAAVSSCAQPGLPAPEPAPVPASPALAADSVPARSIDSVGIPDGASALACATTGRIALDADSVALRFTAAFLKVGILPIRLSLPSVDGVTAGPVEVTVPAPMRLSARATTGMRNDSTVYRVEVRVGPPAQGWTAGDSTAATADASGICGRVVGLAFPRAAAAAPSTQPGDIAFVGATVIPMVTADSILRDHVVVIRGGTIVDVAPATAVRLHPGTRVIDARGSYLAPGLIDAHVHLEHFDDPGVLGLFVAAGVTSVRNMDGRPFVTEWRERIAAGELIGPTIVTAGPVLDGEPPILEDNTVVRDAAEGAAAVAAHRAAGYDFIKVYSGLSADAYRGIIGAAARHGMPVAGHRPRSIPLDQQLGSGQRSLEHTPDFGPSIEHDESDVRGRFHWSRLYLAVLADPARMASVAQSAAASGTWFVPTLFQAERALPPADSVDAWLRAPGASALPAEAHDFWREHATRATARLDSADWRVVQRGSDNRRRLVGMLHAAGARIALGTDTPNPFVIPGFSVHHELAHLRASGMTAGAALQAATLRGAELLGIAHITGSIEAGKRADLVLLRADPLEDAGAFDALAGTMLRGVWYPRPTLDSMVAALGR